MTITWLGMSAGVLTTIAIVPQLIKTWRTRHARDLSIWQQIILIVGMKLWLIYGICLGDAPLIIANAVSLFCYLLLFAMKIYFDRADKQQSGDYI